MPGIDAARGAEILQDARRHLDTTDGRASRNAGERWDFFLDRIAQDASRLKTTERVILYAQTKIGFDHRVRRAQFAPHLNHSLELLLAEFPQLGSIIRAASDSIYSRPDTVVKVGDRLLSNMTLYHLRYILVPLAYTPPPATVVEIGGGYGAPARMWLANPECRPRLYAIVDFPESLFFCEVFLRANFPDLRLLYVEEPRPLADDSSQRYDVILCPLQHVDALAELRFHLAINSGSLQEMTEEWVDFWMRWLDAVDVRFFYSLNYFAQPLDELQEAKNTWSPRLSDRWVMRYQRADPAFVKTQTVRNYAELVAEKLAPADRASCVDAAARYRHIKERVLDGQTFLEALDAVRLSSDEELAWDLLKRCMSELPRVPKEAQFLCEHLVVDGSDGLQERHRGELDAMSARLHAIRSAGLEGAINAEI